MGREGKRQGERRREERRQEGGRERWTERKEGGDCVKRLHTYTFIDTRPLIFEHAM